MGKTRLRKKWPNRTDLLSWFLFHKIQEATCAELDDPEYTRIWLQEFDKTAMIDTHRMLYSRHQNFRVEYINPWYMSNGVTTSG